MDNDTYKAHRRYTYWLLILIGLAISAGRIAVVTSKEGDTPFLSANDRSRWCTIAALVEARTYEIDQHIKLKNRQGRRPWYTIDMVRHRGDDGELHYYSSKPPLLPTIIAGIYWLVYQATGMTLSAQPIYVGRIVLALVNLPLLAIFYCCTIGTIERLGQRQWSRVFLAAATCFGTMMMPFAISLNNHLVAAAATATVMYVYVSAAMKANQLKIDGPQRTSGRLWLVAGMAAGFSAANELPALSMMVMWYCLVLLLDFRRSFSFLAGILMVAAAFFATNKLAHDSFRPPYTHRGDGDQIGWIEDAPEQPTAEQVARVLVEQHVPYASSSELTIRRSGEAGRWVARSADDQLFAVTRKGESEIWQVRYWDDWYDYPSSYWVDGKRKGVDLGEPSRRVYLAHMTVGHYGIFSLTPIWLLVPLGLIAGLFTGPASIRRFVLAAGIATAVCGAFYVMRPEIDRNYGGVSCCFRWMLWFAPLWLAAIVPVTRWCSKIKLARGFCYLLLAVSTFSMAISLTSPWQHPWIYRYWSFLGWIGG